MKIKPRFGTSDISFADASAEVKVAKINKPSSRDPQGVIPSGIYKVFRTEKILYVTNIIILTIIILVCSAYIAGLATDFFQRFGYQYQSSWSLYIIPVILIGLALTKLSLTSIEISSLNRTLKHYRQNLVKDEKYTPSFIVRLYKKIALRQVHHNWMTIFILFYGGLVTVALYFLRDQVWLWGLLDFKKMLNSLFWAPEAITILFGVILVGVLVFQVVMLIIRKKRLVDIETFFGNDVIAQSQINELKTKRNKILFRVFWLSIALILVIPIIVLFIIKRFLKRK